MIVISKGCKKFCFGGRLIFGPDVRSLMLTVPLIVVPVIFFVLFVSDKLVNEFQHPLGKFIVDFAVVFAAYDVAMLFLTSGRDPGIVPRNAQPPELTDFDSTSPRFAEWSGAYTGSSLPLTKDVFVNGIVVKVKYCNTLELPLDPDSEIMGAYHCNLWQAVLQSPVSGILIIYTFIGAWFVGGLTAFHLYLVCTNQTTYENFRYRYDGKKNPYNHGCIHNVKEILFSEIPKSMNNFRAMVKEDSSRFSSSNSMGRAISPPIMKPDFDLEMGVKRHNVAADELDDLQNQFQLGALERCDFGTPRSDFSTDKSNQETPKHVKEYEMDHHWEKKQDTESFSAEFKMY
ncbi:hypothetical protein ZIOFF_028656 [Zingiber officinale]|uniref:S-acyltransferase n=1 Tax=Zingiber officinale TaxID=94328 RepID=A0A8J5LF59_ZINOF|nr:hypothetical protein ZIOFF_028656 [Zingiber officinale]